MRISRRCSTDWSATPSSPTSSTSTAPTWHACDPAELDFVGRTEELAAEITRLGALLGVELGEFRENVNTEQRELPFDRATYAPFFEADYRFLADRLGPGLRHRLIDLGNRMGRSNVSTEGAASRTLQGSEQR